MKKPPASDRPGHPEPPPGSPWDDRLDEAPLCFVDLEMTGLRAADDRVIEVCVERVRGGRVEAEVTSLVRPEGGVFGNAHIHGIDPAEVDRAPSFAALAPAVEAVLEGGIVVAHAAAWDVAFLEAELARAGRPRRFPHYLDTLALSRRAFAFGSHRLSALCHELGIVRARAHRAADDVAALRAVFGRVAAVLAPRTPRDLWHVRVGQRHARPEVLAAAVAALEREEPVSVRYRPAHRAPSSLLFRITEVRTDLDPPQVLGYLLPSRSRRELRADRILAIEPACHDGAASGPKPRPGEAGPCHDGVASGPKPRPGDAEPSDGPPEKGPDDPT
jgi:DNA polymerase-3 subunit epsilon